MTGSRTLEQQCTGGAAAIRICFTGFYSRHRQGRIELPPPQVYTERYSTTIQHKPQHMFICNAQNKQIFWGIPGELHFSTAHYAVLKRTTIGWIVNVCCCEVKLSTAEHLSGTQYRPAENSALGWIALGWYSVHCIWIILHLIVLGCIRLHWVGTVYNTFG